MNFDRRTPDGHLKFDNDYNPGVGTFTNYEQDLLQYFSCLIEEHRAHWTNDKGEVTCPGCKDLKKLSNGLYNLVWSRRKWQVKAA